MSRGPSSLDVEAMLKARHGSSASSLDVEADRAYPVTQISALMQSPCRPEENGYFGGTSGFPNKIFYDFEIETRSGADIGQAVLVVQEHLMDVLLALTFPSVCSFDGDGPPPELPKQQVGITGYRFGREPLDLSRKQWSGMGAECWKNSSSHMFRLSSQVLVIRKNCGPTNATKWLDKFTSLEAMPTKRDPTLSL